MRKISHSYKLNKKKYIHSCILIEEITYLQETITLLEQEMVINQLLLHFLGHALQREVGALELTGESIQGGLELVLHLLVLSLSQARVEGVALHGASTTHTGGDDVLASGVKVAKGINITPVLSGVLVCGLEATVVIFNDGVEESSKCGVRLSIRSIDTHTRVGVLNTRLDHIQEGGVERCLLGLEGIVHLSGEVLLEQRLALSGLELRPCGLQFLHLSGVHHIATRLQAETQQKDTLYYYTQTIKIKFCEI